MADEEDKDKNKNDVMQLPGKGKTAESLLKAAEGEIRNAAEKKAQTELKALAQDVNSAEGVLKASKKKLLEKLQEVNEDLYA